MQHKDRQVHQDHDGLLRSDRTLGWNLRKCPHSKQFTKESRMAKHCPDRTQVDAAMVRSPAACHSDAGDLEKISMDAFLCLSRLYKNRILKYLHTWLVPFVGAVVVVSSTANASSQPVLVLKNRFLTK